MIAQERITNELHQAAVSHSHRLLSTTINILNNLTGIRQIHGDTLKIHTERPHLTEMIVPTSQNMADNQGPHNT
jgi:hypothetical protein